MKPASTTRTRAAGRTRTRAAGRTPPSGKTSPPVALDGVRELDTKLARTCRGAGALRLRLGACLDALARRGGHRELGFSSLEAYALERCGRSARWVQESRKLASTMAQAPRIEGAVLCGRIGWSMAALIARHVSPEEEAAWEEESQRRTFREMKRLLLGPRGPFNEEDLACGEVTAEPESREHDDARDEPLDGRARDKSLDGGAAFGKTPDGGATPGETPDGGAAPAPGGTLDARETLDGGDRSRTLSITADREDIWLYECARMVIGHVCGHHVCADEVVSALVAEGTTTLLPFVPANVPDDGMTQEEAAQLAWEAQLAAYRDEAEALCERRFRTWSPGAEMWPSSADAPGGFREATAESIDAQLRELAAELAGRDLAIGHLAEAFWAADGWRMLHYASARQYAREQLGMSLSSVKEKRLLARRLDAMPTLKNALSERTLGYESTRLVARIVTPETEHEWVARAGERTVRHLREDVEIAAMMARRTGAPTLRPPDDELVREAHVVESLILSGAAFLQEGENGQDAPSDGQTSSPQASKGQTSPGALKGQTSSPWPSNDVTRALTTLFGRLERIEPTRTGRCSGGRVTLRLRVDESTYREYRKLERLHQRFGPRGHGFLAFLSLSLIETWKGALGRTGAFASIHARDRYRCQSPVCGRRDVTPHHLRFRSAGGDDSEDNLVSVCSACHLEGIHGGRLKASPPASRVRWAIGRTPHTWVEGRRKIRGERLS